MPTRVQLPDGSIGEFPDGMSNDQIETVLAKQYPSGDSLQNVPGALPGMQTPSEAAGIHPPKLEKSAIDYGKVLAAGDVGIGAGKGIAHTLGTIGSGEYALMPKALKNTAYGRNFGAGLKATEEAATPTNAPQRIGHGIEQAAEFMVPGGAEEAGAVRLAGLAPKLGRFAKPLAHVVTSALGAGAVNAAQGGSPLEGAAMGAGGRAVGEAAALAAPTITGIAQGLKPEDYAKTGTAILEDTKGIFPSHVRGSARKTLDVLNPELDTAARAASAKPNPVKALLPAPPTTIPLAEIPGVEPSMTPMAFDAERLPQGNITGMGTDLSPTGVEGRIRGVPGRNVEQLGSTANTIPARLQREAYVSGSSHPELSGQIPISHGVLVRPFEAPNFDIPPTIPNPIVSLAPARNVAQAEVARQVGRSNPKMFKGVRNMARQLEVNPLGEPIPENVTPFEALELKRGIGQAQPKGSWSPESANAFKGPRTSIYKTLNEGFENAVPEAAPLNRRISALIPATKPPQNIFWGHALGPAVGGLYGGLRGAHSGGFEGAAAGAAEGALLGLAIPAGLNTVARGAYSPMARNLIIPAAVGATAQATRKKKESQ